MLRKTRIRSTLRQCSSDGLSALQMNPDTNLTLNFPALSRRLRNCPDRNIYWGVYSKWFQCYKSIRLAILNRRTTRDPPLCKPADGYLLCDWLQQWYVLHEIRPVLSCPHALSVTAPQPNNMARRDFELAHGACELVGVLSSVNHKGLHQSSKQTSICLPVILPTSDKPTTHATQLIFFFFNLVALLFAAWRVERVCSGPQGPDLLYQTQSYDPISCYGNSMERTNEIAYRVRVFA